MDPEKAKRFDRAGSESRSTYYRAQSALEAVRKREAAEAKAGANEAAASDVGRGRPAAGRVDASDVAPAGPDINPQARRRMIAPEPAKATSVVTEVVAAEAAQVGTSDGEYGTQNEPRNGRNEAAGDRPAPARPDPSPPRQPDARATEVPAIDDGALHAPYNPYNPMSPELTP
jgi:hypothetical protein